MTPEQFAYWLHGFFEVAGSNQLTPKQVAVVKEHLELVFKRVTMVAEPTMLPISDRQERADVEAKEKVSILARLPMLRHASYSKTRYC